MRRELHVAPFFFVYLTSCIVFRMTDIVLKQESYNIIGVCLRVYEELGGGFLESVYGKAIEKEFKLSGIPFEKQVKLNIQYKGEDLGKYFIADFVVYGKIILEIKAVSYLVNQHLSQTLNYLKATDTRLGLVVNFGNVKFQYRRVLNSSLR